MPTDARTPKDPTTVIGLAESCFVGDVESAARSVVDQAVSGRGGYVCLCNVHLLTLAVHDAAVRAALAGAWQRLPDGAPVAWLQRRAGTDGAQRVGGPDLMPRVVALGREVGLRHFLLGSTPEVASAVERALLRRFPGADIVGRHSPPFGDLALSGDESIEAIAAASPDVVWCALGAPKQELWMHRHAAGFPDAVFLGVGAAFDFLADAKPRAPGWMRDNALEWLHRLATEPRRLGGRYLRTNTEFLVRSAVELTRRRLRARPSPGQPRSGA